MTITLATKTLALINSTLQADQGASFRKYQGLVFPHMSDAFRGEDEGFRSHLGASMIGRQCARDIWFGFRWVRKGNHSGRMLRLFNRGHLEEARFIALLLSIGVQVYQQDASGNQFRISDHGGHFGGSGDGVAVGIPDLPANTPCLLEFKTHNDKSFKELCNKGVRVKKPEHYSQMQVYMRKMGLGVALYGAVNKNDDDLYFELVHLDPVHGEQMLERARKIIMLRTAPARINESPSWHACKMCDHKNICHSNEAVNRTCRSCHHAIPQVEGAGGWVCGQTGEVLSKQQQLAACPSYLQFTIDA